MTAGYSSQTKICSLAAYKQAWRALRGKCEPVFLRFARKVGSKRDDVFKTKNRPRGSVFVLEVTAGFEPADNGVADRGLTAWLRHHVYSCYNIIAKQGFFVNTFSLKFEIFLLFVVLGTSITIIFVSLISFEIKSTVLPLFTFFRFCDIIYRVDNYNHLYSVVISSEIISFSIKTDRSLPHTRPKEKIYEHTITC